MQELISERQFITSMLQTYFKEKLSLTRLFGENVLSDIPRNGQLKYIIAITSRMRCISYACSIDNDVSRLCATAALASNTGKTLLAKLDR